MPAPVKEQEEMAQGKETASESHEVEKLSSAVWVEAYALSDEDFDSEINLVEQLGHGGIIAVLFETPSGFAVFHYDGLKLLLPRAMENIWADFIQEKLAKQNLSDSLHSAGEHLKDISELNYQDWHLLKLVTAFKLVCHPDKRCAFDKKMFPKAEYARLVRDAPKYEGKVNKTASLVGYNRLWGAHRDKCKALRRLLTLVGPAASVQCVPSVWSGTRGPAKYMKLIK